MFVSCDAIDKRLLEEIQGGVPLVARPFASLGLRLGLSEEDVLSRLTRLKAKDGPIRQVSAIFDSRALGYVSTLVAGQYDADHLEAGGRIICEHPGVSHCYQRDHAFNLWYTLTIPPGSRWGADRTVERLGALSGARVTRSLPAVRTFKIGVQLDLGEGGLDATGSTAGRAVGPIAPIESGDIPLVRALQEDLSIEPEPFDRLAVKAGMTVGDLLARAERLRAAGTLRRYAAVLRHRQVGYVANGMVCWRVGTDRIEAVGQEMAGVRAVSHCYQRATCPEWGYNVYTMIHGHSREECLAVAEEIASRCGLVDRAVLWSVRELKKLRVRYFTGDVEAWEEQHRG